MTRETPATGCQALPKCRGFAGRRGRRRFASVAGFSVAVLALLAGGCGGGKLTQLPGPRTFQEQVLQANRPVLVEFYKDGCMWCGLLEPSLARLAEDYQGRAVFFKYRLMTRSMGVTNWELRTKYGIHWYPTVILFVNGQEKKRWVVSYDTNSYRKALDEALSTKAKPATPARVAPAPAKK